MRFNLFSYFDQFIFKINIHADFKSDFRTEQKSCVQNNSDAEVGLLPRDYLLISFFIYFKANPVFAS